MTYLTWKMSETDPAPGIYGNIDIISSCQGPLEGIIVGSVSLSFFLFAFLFKPHLENC